MAFTYTPIKTWQMLVNQAQAHFTTILAASQDVGFFILQFLTGALGFQDRSGAAIGSPAGLWTVDCSSDGVTASNWGSNDNKILAYTDIVFGDPGSAHSWFVLRSPASFGGLGYPLYLVCSTAGSSGAPTWKFVLGRTPNGNGTATADPTMTNATTAVVLTGVTGAVQQTGRGMLATDGTFMLATGTAGMNSAQLGLAVLPVAVSDIVPGDGYPWMLWANSDNGQHSNQASPFCLSVGSPRALRPTGSVSTTTIPNIASGLLDATGMGSPGDEADHSLPRMPFYLVTKDGASFTSFRGRVDDIFFGPALAGRLTLPNAGPAEIQLDGSVWFWCPSAAHVY
jgi:hypothetical protein